MDLLLTGLQWDTASGRQEGDVRIQNGVFAEMGSRLTPHQKEIVVPFDHHYIYPGLINSHDHLEMNLYSRLGNPPYGNYTEWGNDIYKPQESPIVGIQRVGIEDRLLWGGVRNMISGVTTVVHHNPWHPILERKDFPVTVAKNIAWAHSLAFGERINESFPKEEEIPFVIHAAEGVDALAFGEIRKLHALGVLHKNTVLVHAIALSEEDMDLVRKQKCSVIWCPASNFFLFDRTTGIGKLKENIRLALGSDSTLTGSPTLLDEMHFAEKTGLASPVEILNMVTLEPASMFHLPIPKLAIGANANFLITPAFHDGYADNLLALQVEEICAVFRDGESLYSNAEYAGPFSLKHSFSIRGTPKKSKFDVSALRSRLQNKLGASILDSNPLWQMIGS